MGANLQCRYANTNNMSRCVETFCTWISPAELLEAERAISSFYVQRSWFIDREQLIEKPVREQPERGDQMMPSKGSWHDGMPIHLYILSEAGCAWAPCYHSTPMQVDGSLSGRCHWIFFLLSKKLIQSPLFGLIPVNLVHHLPEILVQCCACAGIVLTSRQSALQFQPKLCAAAECYLFALQLAEQLALKS